MFNHQDRALLYAIAHSLNIIIEKENLIVATVADIQAQSAKLITEVTAETNAETAVAALVTGLQKQVTDLTAQLNTAIANGADPPVPRWTRRLGARRNGLRPFFVYAAGAGGTAA